MQVAVFTRLPFDMYWWSCFDIYEMKLVVLNQIQSDAVLGTSEMSVES